VKKDKHCSWHHNRCGQFNAGWRAVEAEEKAAIEQGGLMLTKQQLIQKLVECRQQFPDTP
jgi:hypothetical protein